MVISLKNNSLTIGLSETEIFSFDLAGRLYTVFQNGVTYRRGLDGSILAKWRTHERQRHWLNESDCQKLEHEVHAKIAIWYETATITSEAKSVIEKILAFDPAQDVARFHQIYQPVGILPPDQYLATVLQLTEGCSFNTCTFCTFYKDQPFRIKPVEEFYLHAQAVKQFLGDGRRLRPTIFLGAANALVVPMAKLLPLLEAVQRVFGKQDVYAFLDGFSGEKKSASDYALLKSYGLKRVYIGLESGCSDLLHSLRKPGTPSDTLQAVQAIKASGISVGIIVMLGIGGEKFAQAHVEETAAILNAMNLDKNDLLYFSHLVMDDTMPYAHQNFQSLSQTQRMAQGEAIQHQLHTVPKISRYDIREFIY